MTLNEVKNGVEVTIIQVSTDEVTRQRLKMLNVFPSANIKVIKRSLLNSSLLLDANGVRVGVRIELAEQIKVITRGE